MNDTPQLLIEWSSPWQEFVEAIGPALRRSPPRQGFETRAGLFPFRGMLLAMLLEIAALALAMVLPLSRLQPATLQPAPPPPDVIYFAADELPRTQDLAGASGGKAGRSGGASQRHIQAIKVARDQVVRERVADAPRLNLPKSDSQIKNLLAIRTDAGPAPAEALRMNRQVPQMAMAVAPPPPDMPAEMQRQMRQNALVNPAVVPPPVSLSQQNLMRRSLMPSATVVPPPVSAPAELRSHPARLTLPDQAVVAPRPEIGGTVQSRRMNNNFNPRVAPPPVDLAAVRSSASTTALNGTQTVVAPPVELHNTQSHAMRGLGGGAVAPPPVEIQSVQARSVRGLGSAAVAAPPAELASLNRARALGGSGASVLPPPAPPSANGHDSSSGAGAGKGPSTSNAGVVVSAQPGKQPGAPAKTEKATLAMAPDGAAIPGPGGGGNGGGLSRGFSSGSAPAGVGSGSTAVGSGRGASPYDRPGNSPAPGPGGAGNMSSGNPPVPGVSVSSGSNSITLPSFGAATDPASRGHSTAKGAANGITIVAGPRSGGALNLYGALKGDRVYTIYINTSAGPAIMQFADPDSVAHPNDVDLAAPQTLRINVPSGLQPSRLLIACVLDSNGSLRHWRVLEADSGDFSAKILAALPDWKFTPAFRGNQAVEVNVILGFGVDTK